MDFKETLGIVKAQNPGISHKEAQKKASILFQAYKSGQEQLKQKQGGQSPAVTGSPASPAPKPRLAGAISTADLQEAEKAIRKGPIDVAKIMAVGFQVIPDGKIVNYGKATNVVNSLVAFEDETGNRLPVEGFFEIFL